MFEVCRFETQRGSCSSPHEHNAGELVWTPNGLVFAELGTERWSLPTSRALWIPGGWRHAAGASRDSVLLVLSALSPCRLDEWVRPTPLIVSALARELMLELGSHTCSRRDLVESLLVESLQPVALPTTRLPMPTEPVAVRVATALLADPGDQRTLHEFGRLVGASARTLARYFVADTGMTFGDWRAQARLRTAMVELSRGTAVNQVAARVGYDTPSGFISAFRRFAGCTPGRYQQSMADRALDESAAA